MTERRAATARGPGRVNLVGEHTDYNGGLALPFPIAAGCTVRAEAIDGPDVVAVAQDLGEEDRFPLADVQPAEGWRAFVRGMVAELARAGFTVRPARVTISADVPRGRGLSSSAALEVALALAWLALSGEEDADRVELARLCSRVENDWVGRAPGCSTSSLRSRARPAMRCASTSRPSRSTPCRWSPTGGGWCCSTRAHRTRCRRGTATTCAARSASARPRSSACAGSARPTPPPRRACPSR